MRVENEVIVDTVFDEDSDFESTPSGEGTATTLNDVPEVEEGGQMQADEPVTAPAQDETRQSRRTAQQQSALGELYLYEILALLSCFLLPLVGAYLLHAIRSQLSRPSEGLVSNYNLTIFLLVSEMRVLSHLIKLLKSRTVHLQRVVQANGTPSTSLGPIGKEQLDKVIERLGKLESRSPTEETGLRQNLTSDSDRLKQEAVMTRDVRNAIQPELDALNRAVRRYEKKATLLQFQTESRFMAVDAKLEDAIALAAAAAKNNVPRQNVLLWAAESLLTVFLLPVHAMLQVLLLPLKTLVGLVNRQKRQQHPPGKATTRATRQSRTQGSPRWNNDGQPNRVGKR